MVHLAGNFVTIGDRVIQRCLVCWYKLLDVVPSHVMVAFDSRGDYGNKIPTFEVGHLIEVREGDPTSFRDLGDSKQPSFDAAWDDCCIHLVEE
jgi:hypothetical protein